MRAMPPRLAVLALLATALTGSTGAQPAAYTLDPTHSFVHFEVLHFDTATIRGRFGPLQGEVQLDRAARSGRVQLTIPTAGVSTGLPVLDARLREADMLDATGHPKAFFVAERFEFTPDGSVAAVTGEFTLRGRSRALRLVAQRFRCYTSPLLRREVCGGDFDADLLRSDFGFTHSLPFVADVVRLRVQVEAVRQSP
ncbi:MAG: polyisoprenoid-binding protein [Burkholderiales bacterium PBB5]|nr:MAG: polyisoprenoid-binding protein [Burkholderiales bacterium PBB5]